MYFDNFNDYTKKNSKSAKHFLSGIVLIMENKILLVHPTKFKDKPNKWSIPKGHNETNMSDLETAITELEEEANIKIHPYKFENSINGVLNYIKGAKNKELKYYVLNISRSDLDFKLYNNMILRYFLDKLEISEAGFFSKNEAIDLIEEQQKELLRFLT